jgi:GT2 family glycosyltransferase
LSAEAWAPQVSFIILNFNDRPHLGPCLDAVAQHAAAIPHETIVVDNASTDDSVRVVAATRTGFTLLRNAENVGFARAMNRGAAASRGEFLAFLNTDVVLRPGTMEALLAEFDRNPSTGAVGPALRTPGGGYQVSFGGRRTFGRELLQKLCLNARQARALRKRRRRREVRWVSGAFLLVRRSAFEAARGFDEAFFLYFEDIDLCFRLREAGWDVVYLPAAEAEHEGGVTTAAQPWRSRYAYRKSQLYFYRQHNPPLSGFLLRLFLWLDFRLLAWRGALTPDTDPPRERFFALLKERTP